VAIVEGDFSTSDHVTDFSQSENRILPNASNILWTIKNLSNLKRNRKPIALLFFLFYFSVKQHIDISQLSGYQTPAQARYFVAFDGDNREEVQAATKFAHEMKAPILTIAGGKNSLLAFDEYPGLVIYNTAE